MIRKWFNQKEISTPKYEVENNKNGVLILREHIINRGSSNFPSRWPLSYPKLTKDMISYIHVSCKQHKNLVPKHKK